MSEPAAGGRRRRAAIGAGFLVLFLFALAVFLLPFAFPTEGAIVARFASQAQFSPNTPGGRAAAGIAIQMRNSGTLSLTVLQDHTTIRTLIPTRHVRKGWITITWDGRNDAGQTMRDGSYTLHLVATSGKKGYNANRRAIINRVRPAAPTVSATSATLGLTPAGTQCTITATPSTNARFTFAASAADATQITSGPVFVAQGAPATWNWTGRGGAGEILAPSFYPVTATELSVNGFTFTTTTACWIGNLAGTVQPSGAAAGDTVQIKLTSTTGATVPANTPVLLQVYRRRGTPADGGATIGPPVGAPVTTTAGVARLTLPAGIPPSRLWIRAQTHAGVALIAAGGTG